MTLKSFATLSLASMALTIASIPACAVSNSDSKNSPAVAPADAPVAPGMAKQINIGWVGLTRPWSFFLTGHYLVAPENTAPLTIRGGLQAVLPPSHIKPDPAFEFMGRDVPAISVVTKDLLSKSFVFAPWPANSDDKINMIVLPAKPNSPDNPFLAAPKDFNVGDYLPWPLGTPAGQFPLPNDIQLNWYDEQLDQGLAPDIWMVGGHHVISEGYHNNEETSFIFEQGIFWAAANDPGARAYFDHVKVAILFGCNTLTDLEPHHADGSVMEPEEIKKLYESGPQGRQAVLGTAKVINSMEFYKNRLATEYGEHSHEYSYTRSAAKEKCIPNSLTTNCPVANLERILPDSGLFDGTHRYNEAMKARELFRNAYLVLGFSSASPSEEERVQILQRAVQDATKQLNIPGKNAMDLIIEEATPEPLRKSAIVALRHAWEKATFAMNRHRPSGSITPRYPDIDRGYVMEVRQTNDPQLYAKYR